MSASETPLKRAAFWRGLVASAPFFFVVAPFATLFGIVATEAGFSVLETFAFSLAVFAGASQFTALHLMEENAPMLIILATALAVNLRLSMYSASLAPHLGKLSVKNRAITAFFLIDQCYAASMIEFEERPQMSSGERFAFFVGTFIVLAPIWYVFTLVGALAGTALPQNIGLDFAMPLTFIALTGPMLRSLPHVMAALTSIVLVLTCHGLPYSSGILVAGIGGMVVAAALETWMERHR